MDWKLTHETLCQTETVWEGTAEQGYSLDYLLPDYCSGVFKLLKCFAYPVVTGKMVVGNKLTLDGAVQLRVLYIGEETHEIASLTQSVPFTKTVELPRSCNEAVTEVSVSGGSVSCRVVNAKRLDIHGSVLLHATVTQRVTTTVLTDVQGLGVQTHKITLPVDGDCKRAERQCTVLEDFDATDLVGSTVLDMRGGAVLTEQKLLVGKAIVKGEISLHLLLCRADGSLTPWRETLPFSQIIDVSGLCEDDTAAFSAELLGMEVTDPVEENPQLSFRIQLRLCCTAYDRRELALLTDAYSVCHPCELQRTSLRLTRLEKVLQQRETAHFDCPLENFLSGTVADVLCDISGVQTEITDQGISLAVAVRAFFVGADGEGLPFATEQTLTYQMTIPCELTENSRFSPQVTVTDCSFANRSGGVDLSVSLAVSGAVSTEYLADAVDAMQIDEESRLPSNDAGLILYFAKAGESVWEIAKSYRCEVAGICAENELDEGALPADRVLLIPAAGNSQVQW